MNDISPHRDDPAIRIDVNPEPTEEEMLAILEVLRALHLRDESGRSAVTTEPRWALTARREGLRSPYWPPQSVTWERAAY